MLHEAAFLCWFLSCGASQEHVLKSWLTKKVWMLEPTVGSFAGILGSSKPMCMLKVRMAWLMLPPPSPMSTVSPAICLFTCPHLCVTTRTGNGSCQEPWESPPFAFREGQALSQGYTTLPSFLCVLGHTHNLLLLRTFLLDQVMGLVFLKLLSTCPLEVRAL